MALGIGTNELVASVAEGEVAVAGARGKGRVIAGTGVEAGVTWVKKASEPGKGVGSASPQHCPSQSIRRMTSRRGSIQKTGQCPSRHPMRSTLLRAGTRRNHLVLEIQNPVRFHWGAARTPKRTERPTHCPQTDSNHQHHRPPARRREKEGLERVRMMTNCGHRPWK